MTRKNLENGLKPFSATGIGSVPFLSTEQACNEIISHESLIPFWPQLVQKDPREDMILQYSPPLPCLQSDRVRKNLMVDPNCNRAETLLHFYEKFLAVDFSFFSLRPDFASGFFRLLELLPSLPETVRYVKGQIVGPITLGLSVRLPSDRFLIHDPELMDTVIKGLALQAVYQVKKFEELNRSSIIFLDEPSLSGYGSAFTPLSKDEVLKILGETIQHIREQTGTLIGLHCCGNTDWSLLLSLDLDIINLDAFNFGHSFLLYPKEIKQFLEKGKTVAWGLVPTAGFTGKETTSGLLDRLAALFTILVGQGIDQDRLYAQSLLTPACGMGTLSEQSASQLLDLLAGVSLKARERFKTRDTAREG
jgi:methionine synthase II (cobalamin-independent)